MLTAGDLVALKISFLTTLPFRDEQPLTGQLRKFMGRVQVTSLVKMNTVNRGKNTRKQFKYIVHII